MEIAALGLRVDGVDNVGKASQSLAGLKKSAQGAEGAFDSLSNDSAKTTKSIKQVGDQSDQTSSKISALGGVAKAAGGVLAAAFSVAAVSGGIKSSLRTYADFESQMAKVGAVSRASEKDFKVLTETAKRLGAETEFSASQAGAGLEFLARAGWSAKESIAAMPAVLNLATSAAMDLGKAADVASNIMSAFGIAATDAADVTDILAAASSRANTDVAQLGDAMSYVGPIAASLKISMGDTAAAIGALSDAGIQGSSAGTGLRRVLSSLANPTKASADEIRSLGISMADVNPQANSLADIIDTLAKGGIDAASAMKIFGDQGGPALLALVDQRSKVRELAETLGDVSGEAQRMAETIGDTLKGDLKGLSSALEGVRISLGDAFSPAARELVQKATAAVRSFGENISTVLATVTLATKLTAAYVVAVYAIPAAKMAASAATSAYTAVLQLFSAQVALTTKTLLSMRTALNVVFAAFAGWQIGSYLRNEFEIVEKAGIALMGGLHTITIRIGGFFSVMGEDIKFAVMNPLDAIRGAIADMLEWVSGLGQTALNFLGFEGLAEGVKTEFAGIRGATAAEHKATLEQIRKETGDQIEMINGIYADMFANVGKSASDASSTIDETKKKTEELGSSIKNVSNGAVKDVGGMSKAFSDLMARLFPAQAAQAKYNAELAILKKHLSGDQLARAVSELTKQFTGGDADGAAKAVEEYNNRLKELTDRLNPAAVAARTFKEEQLLLIDAIKRTGDPTGELARSLEELERQYSETSRVTNEWTRWTESALDRVDGAFADAWRNIGDGFKGFRDNLTNGFKQMLAELAHMAITRPIVMQIGAAMGIGVMSGSAMAGVGGGGGSGGINWGQLASYGQSAYSALTGVGPAALAGWQSGGLWGGAQAIGGYYGNMLGNAASAVGGWLGIGGGGAAAATYAPWLSGIGGAFMGYQNSGLKGAAAGGLGGFGGAKLGASAGAYFGPVGAAVGAILGGALGALGGSKLFGSGEKYKRTVGSATGYYGDDGYVSTGPSATWFPGSRQFGAEHDAVLDDLNNAFVTTIGSLFDAFGVDSTIATTTRTRLRRTSGRMVGDFITEMDGQITNHFRQYSKDGKIGEAMEQFSDDIMGEYLAKTIVGSELPEYFRQQFEGLAADSKVTAEQVAETLTGIFTRFEGVNSVLELTRLAAFELTDAGMRASDAIIALSGGLDALQASTAVYYDQFFTVAEKQADTVAAVEKAFAAADITLADSRESYRAMVEDIDVTTAHGQQMFATMMGLAGQAAQYYDILDARAAQSVAMLAAGLDASFGALQRSIQAQRNKLTQEYQSALQAEQEALAIKQEAARAAITLEQEAAKARLAAYADMIETASGNVRALQNLETALDRALKSLIGGSDAVVEMMRQQAVAQLQNALALSRSGRSLAGMDLEGALGTASRIDAQRYGSLTDFEREQGRTANLVFELSKVNEKQLTAEEALLEQLQSSVKTINESIRRSVVATDDGVSAISKQLTAEYDLAMAGLDAELAYAQSQLDALNGIDNSIMGVASAVSAMNASVVAALKGLSRGSAQANTPANNLSIVDTAYRTVLGREADASGRQYWTDHLQSGSLEYDQFAETLARAALQNPTDSQNSKANALKYLQGLGVPGFASGGIASGPMSGYPVELHGTEAVIPLNGSSIPLNVPGIKALVHEVSELRKELAASQRAIAENTGKSARVLEREEMERRQEEFV